MYEIIPSKDKKVHFLPSLKPSGTRKSTFYLRWSSAAQESPLSTFAEAQRPWKVHFLALRFFQTDRKSTFRYFFSRGNVRKSTFRYFFSRRNVRKSTFRYFFTRGNVRKWTFFLHRETMELDEYSFGKHNGCNARRG